MLGLVGRYNWLLFKCLSFGFEVISKLGHCLLIKRYNLKERGNQNDV